MAKRRLKHPELPPGDRYDFFVWMQTLVLLSGDKSVSELGRLTQFSHQAVHKALTGPRMPSRQIVVALARELAGEELITQAVDRWTRGVAEERVAGVLGRAEAWPRSS